jgi:regulator of protease activity HflC (stomatin/prohibitin superfamily)
MAIAKLAASLVGQCSLVPVASGSAIDLVAVSRVSDTDWCDRGSNPLRPFADGSEVRLSSWTALRSFGLPAQTAAERLGRDNHPRRVPMMALLLTAILVALFVVVLRALATRVIVQDHQAGLLYESGKLVRTLPAGGYWLFRPYSTVQLVDLRTRVVTVPSQEVLTSDNVSIKVSMLLRYRVTQPDVAVRAAVSYEDVVYADAQVALRELVGGLTVEELVAQRDAIAVSLNERLAPKVQALGLMLESAGIKDFVFPPPLRQVFNRVVEARQASQASLEHARGEIATLRSLANAARMLDNNPSLLALKTLQTIADGTHTVARERRLGASRARALERAADSRTPAKPPPDVEDDLAGE